MQDRPLTARELRWLRHIALHGPQSSEFLLELSSDTHRCFDTARRTLQRLREEGYLREPIQQQEIAKANFNHRVYDLTRRSELHLKGLGDPTPVRPQGHWWHAFLTACLTSAIHIEADRHGHRFIPANHILDRNGATLAIPDGTRKLIPDQLFAIKGEGGFRSYVLEVDRGTEPLRSKSARKSLKSMLEQYGRLAEQDALRAHYGLKSPLLILLAFTNPARLAECMEMIDRVGKPLSQLALLQTVPGGFARFVEVRGAVFGGVRRVRGERFGVVG